MRKRIILYLSAIPEDGGKFQYSLSVLEAFQNFESTNLEKIVIYKHDIWDPYISNIDKYEKLSANSIIVSSVKNLLYLLFPNLGRNFWRNFLGKIVDRNHKHLYQLYPDLVIFASKDPFVHELDLPSIIPVFDLMHKYESFPELFNNTMNNDRDLYYNRLVKYAKGILVDSEVGAKHVLDNFSEANGKIHVLKYVCPSYVFDYNENDDLISKYKLPSNYFLYPAQFWLHKNHENIIKAVHLLKKKGVEITCVFVGSKKNGFNQILKLIDELEVKNNFIILSYVSNEELIELYKNAIALIMPTFFGPTNIPPLEAINLGCPVITSNIYAAKEQLGDAAILVDPNNVEEISNAMHLINSNPKVRNELIKRGFEKSTEYSIDVFSEKLQKILYSILWEKE